MEGNADEDARIHHQQVSEVNNDNGYNTLLANGKRSEGSFKNNASHLTHT